MKRLRLFALLIILPLFAFSSCKGKWNSSFSSAQDYAIKKERPIFMYVDSGSEASVDFKNTVLNSKEFLSYAGKKVSLLHVNLVPEADDKKTEEEINAVYEEQSKIVLDFNVEDEISLFLLSPEGYYLSHLPWEEKYKSSEELISALENQLTGSESISKLISDVGRSSGVERVRAIDVLYESTDENYRRPLIPLCRQVLEIDTDNVTGLLGKYELQTTFDDVYLMLNPESVDEAAQRFVDVAEKGHLDRAQKFEAYYYAAYLYPLVGSTDYEKMLGLLQKSYDADPKNEHAGDISETIKMVESMKSYQENSSLYGSNTELE